MDNLHMRYETLRLRCECGRATSRIREVGFTADHQLVLNWKCTRCKRLVYVFKALSDCWRDCPTIQRESGGPEEERMNAFDVVFLRRLGIRYADDAANQVSDRRAASVDESA